MCECACVRACVRRVGGGTYCTVQLQVSPTGISARAQTHTMIRMYFCVFGRCAFYPTNPPTRPPRKLFHFQLRPLDDPSLCQHPRRAMKESDQWLRVRCSGIEPGDKRSFKVALRFPSTPRGQPSDPPAVSKTPSADGGTGQARTCFVRLGIRLENC